MHDQLATAMLSRAEVAHAEPAEQPGIMPGMPATGPTACPECKAPPGAACETWCAASHGA